MMALTSIRRQPKCANQDGLRRYNALWALPDPAWMTSPLSVAERLGAVTAARNLTRVRNGGPLDPRPSPLVGHPLAFDILLASPRPPEPLTAHGFASLSCPRYSFRLF